MCTFLLFSSQLSWQFAVSNPDRTLIALLQEQYLEIRHKRDEYEKPIGRITRKDLRYQKSVQNSYTP